MYLNDNKYDNSNTIDLTLLKYFFIETDLILELLRISRAINVMYAYVYGSILSEMFVTVF